VPSIAKAAAAFTTSKINIAVVRQLRESVGQRPAPVWSGVLLPELGS